MALDRTKFKATSVAKTIEKDKELNDQLGRDGGARADYMKLDNGVNIIRIYPPHPEEDGGGDVFAEAKVTVFLPMMVVQRDDRGQEMIDPATRRPILKESVKSVFNSRIHGNTPKDLVEEYIGMARTSLEEDIKQCQDSKMKGFLQSKLESITGNFAKKIQGLRYKQAWVIYAEKIQGKDGKFGTLEIGPAIKERLNSLAASTDVSGDPLATDPFTDIETGRAVIITYNKDAQRAQDYYKTELDNATINQVIAGRSYQLPRQFPLSDDQLEKFSRVTPLNKRFRGVFKMRDFELQMEGLEFFDSKNQIGLFQNPNWLKVCEEIRAYYPEEGEEVVSEEEVESAPISAEAPSASEPLEEEADQFEIMSRKELAVWLKANRTGILVKPTMSDDDLRMAAREWSANIEEEEEVLEEEEERVTSQIPATTTTKTSAAERLAALRQKAAQK